MNFLNKMNTKSLQDGAVKTLSVLCVATLLVACSAGDAPLETNEPAIDAASLDPCAEQFDFQRELNGDPDDILQETVDVEGKSLTKVQYWYESSSMIVYFTYASRETWCNVWNESGVVWPN